MENIVKDLTMEILNGNTHYAYMFHQHECQQCSLNCFTTKLEVIYNLLWCRRTNKFYLCHSFTHIHSLDQ